LRLDGRLFWRTNCSARNIYVYDDFSSARTHSTYTVELRLNSVTESDIHEVLMVVYPEYTDDLPPDNASRIISGLVAGRQVGEVLAPLKTGGLQMDYAALLSSFTDVANLIVAVLMAWYTVKRDRREDEAAEQEAQRLHSVRKARS
jgi:hypothetical protein